jgi:hypothetical protein
VLARKIVKVTSDGIYLAWQPNTSEWYIVIVDVGRRSAQIWFPIDDAPTRYVTNGRFKRIRHAKKKSSSA